MLGKKLRCPKCREVFRAPADVPEPARFDSLDFEDSQPTEKAWLAGELPGDQPSDLRSELASDLPTEFSSELPSEVPSGLSSELPLDMAVHVWSAPVREVSTSNQSKPTLSKEEFARRQSRREYSLLMVGGAVCAVLALVIAVVGSMVVWRSIQRQAAESLAAKQADEAGRASAGSASSGSGSSATGSGSGSVTAGSGNLPDIFGFDETRRSLLVDYLVSQGNGKPKAKLTMAMVVNALKKLAADFNVEPTTEFPEQLGLLRERVIMRDVPEELLTSAKMPAVFAPMISEYQEKKLGPAEEQVAILVILAFLGAEM